MVRSPQSNKKLLHIACSEEFIQQIDDAASNELLTRSEFIRRSVMTALRTDKTMPASKLTVDLLMTDQELDEVYKTLFAIRWRRKHWRREYLQGRKNLLD